jgi:hypothetical protein
VILAEASFKVHIILLYFIWKSPVCVLLGSFFILSFTIFISLVLDCTVKLLLKHVNGFDRVLDNIFGKFRVEVSEIVKVDVKSVFSFRN